MNSRQRRKQEAALYNQQRDMTDEQKQVVEDILTKAALSMGLVRNKPSQSSTEATSQDSETMAAALTAQAMAKAVS